MCVNPRIVASNMGPWVEHHYQRLKTGMQLGSIYSWAVPQGGYLASCILLSVYPCKGCSPVLVVFLSNFYFGVRPKTKIELIDF